MKRKSDLPELLAPAGSLEALIAAVNAGADAVYIGASSFNARINAKNFTEEEMRRGILYAHLHSAKVYVTLNTLIYDNEIKDFLDCAAKIAHAGADALIMADIGMISLVHKYFPELEIHASTQLTVHNTAGADFAFKMGAVRVVPSRELSFENIKKITENSRAEVEMFLHGALCVSYSGQCLFSSLVGGRSGNRGECAQACRLPYNNTYPLSLKDLCLANHITELIESGISSLKIEGRMKSPDYVYETVKIYRTLLNEKRNASKDELARLERIFSRDGFTDGYFSGKISQKMTGIRSSEAKADTREFVFADTEEKKLPIKAEAYVAAGEPSRLSLSLGDITVTAEGPVAREAISRPLDAAQIKERTAKLGGTLFTLADNDITASVGENLNLSPAEINALRRACAEALEERVIGQKNVSPPLFDISKYRSAKAPALRTALCFFAEQLDAICAGDNNFFDIVFIPLFKLRNSSRVPDGVYLPPIITDSEVEAVKNELKYAKERGVRYALCGNIGHVDMAKALGFEIFADFRFNITNSVSAHYITENIGQSCILSPELSLSQIRDIGGSVITYGRIPLMLLERCFIRENGGCEKCNKLKLRDRRGVIFPLLREHPHRNILFNSLPTYMGDKADVLKRCGIDCEHFIFSIEKPAECIKIILDYKNKVKKDTVRRIK